MHHPKAKAKATTTAMAVVSAAVLLVGAACSKGSEKQQSGPASLLDATSLERTSGPTPSPGCSTPTAQVTGDHTDTAVTAAGLTGHVWQYLPTSYTGSTPVPLVIDLHGLTETYGIQPEFSAFPAVADANGFAYIAPGVDADIPWWDAEPTPTARDDTGFLRGVIAQEEAALCLDTSRVYVAGMSNGALMASAIGCSMADVVTAVAPVAGLRFPPDCHPSRPVPVVAFHGTADQFVDFQTGGAGPAVASLKMPPEFAERLGQFAPIPIADSAQKWADAEGCSSPPVEEQVSAQVKLLKYGGCAQGSAVELYIVDGGGHSWPGSTFSAKISSVVGATTMDITASELIWKFFSQYQLPPS